MVIVDKAQKTALIVDVTVSFENRPHAFVTAREEKIRQYSALAEHMHSEGFNTTISTFVMGSHGRCDKKNPETLITLGIGRRYSMLMKQLIVAVTMKWSRDLYVEHIT